MNSIHGFPCDIVPSPHDNRDFVYETIKCSNDILTVGNKTKTRRALLPKELDLRPFLNRPRSQGSRGTCAAFSAAAIKEYQERIDVNYKGYMSPEYIYYFRKNKPSSGMYGRNVMTILSTKGSIAEERFKYSSKIEPVDLSEGEKKTLTDEGTNFVIKKYARINTIQGLKEALFSDGPCLICVPVYRGSFPDIWKQKKIGDASVGGHAMTVVGYTKTGFIIRNSWGDGWNGDGYVIFPYRDWGCQWEIWSPVDDKSNRVPIVPRSRFCIFNR